MWAKAGKLISMDGHILKVPDPKPRLVKSSTSDQPQLVTRNPKNMNLFCCDKCCPMFNVCSQVIASARNNGCLRSFLDQLRGVCHLTSLLSQIMACLLVSVGKVEWLNTSVKDKHPTVDTRSFCQCISDSQLSAVTAAINTANGPCTSSTLKLRDTGA